MGMFGKSEPIGIKLGDIVDHKGVVCVVVKIVESGLYLVPVGPPVPEIDVTKAS